MVQVKICGVCRQQDARVAGEAGADCIGVILAPGRTRSRSRAEAAAILDAGGVRRAGVFVDAPPGEIVDAARDLDLDIVQLHGDETTETIARVRESFAGELWKAVRVRSAADVTDSVRTYAGVTDALLLEGWSPAAHGGAGARFDWTEIARSAAIPAGARIVLAGGLTPDNVAAAVALLRPAIVDVSSGVESTPGRKSPHRIRAFIAAARGVLA